MTNFQFYTYELPCFHCHMRKVETELGWFTPSLKADVVDQIETILKVRGTHYEPYITVEIICTEDEAKDYLLLNYYGYSEHDINHGRIESDDIMEVRDQISEHMTAEGVAVFKHEIALQNCEYCTQDDIDY